MSRAVLSVDLGGTHMRAALVDADGTILERSIADTPHDGEGAGALEDLAAGVLAGSGATMAVIGVPGRVDYQHGTVGYAPNLPAGWMAELTTESLAASLDVTVCLANDGDIAAVGEGYHGAGRGYRDVAYVTISTGVGAGILLDGRVVHGRRSIAELGHTTIDRLAQARGEPCTVEDLGSGTTVGRLAIEAGIEASGEAFDRLVDEGDPTANGVWEEVLGADAVAVTNLAHLFTPEVVVIGGGLGRSSPRIVDVIRDHVDRHGPPGLPTPIEVAPAALGDDSGLVGAASWQTAFGLDP